MINKLWTGVSLENYNNWYPLTGKITETPQQYIQTWPNVNDWFKTFAIRAQNDINAYLGFILSKFPFDSFKDELIKETLRDMVYVTAEHWVFNRTPIEFNVDTTIQFNNGSQFSANSIPTINVWDLAPSRMKIWARLTELKQILSNYNDDEIDVEKIDLKAFYTRNQVDELIEQQKEFTLSKQIKLYDDLVNDNENEIYRGPVSKFVNKGYVATDYDKETETMILDWPDEIGTLPPEALQNNPQIGDYTHAPTCDFSAKQQKRITTNENEIIKLNNELIKANENINDVKNNWFNIETSPLWKKVKNENIKTDTWYIIDWTYYFIDSKQLIISNNKLIKSNIRITNSQIEQKQIIVENIDVNIDKVTLLYDVDLIKFIATNSTKKYIPIIHNIYQYIGKDTPIEFITEEGTERDYYTKLETNNLLDKKQDKLIAGENIKIDEKTNTISAIGESHESLWLIDPNSPNIIQPKEKRLITSNNTRIVYIADPEQPQDATNKRYVDEKNDTKQNKLLLINENMTYGELKYNKLPEGKFGDDLGIPPNKVIKEWISESVNKKQDKIDNLQDKIFNNKDDKESTTRLVNEVIKTNVGGKTLIYRNNPNITDDLDIPNKKYIDDKIKSLNIIKWKNVGTKESDIKINYNFKLNTLYKVGYSWNTNEKSAISYIEFLWQGKGTVLDNFFEGTYGKNAVSNYVDLLLSDKDITMERFNYNEGRLHSLEEEIKENTYQINSNTLNIIAPEKIDIEKPIKINSYSLETNEIRENEWDIELKNNPTPTPNIPQWKEVGTREKNKWDNWQITYDFQENKHYRVYYSWSIYNPVYTIQEFIITDKKIAGVQIQTFNDSANIVILSVQHAKLITIYTGKGNLKGNVWKLEELQE
ncbi:hypothetical protein [Spiroplasma endosymbiont of Phycita roborella]|uniref:hypothetical protein n=1 Tax=Spiroplasma endosymbiont of Phycita roborella TaxID=3066311 RepID=UPI00313CF7DA